MVLQDLFSPRFPQRNNIPLSCPYVKTIFRMESTVDKNNNNKGQKSSSTRLAFNSSPFLLWVHPLRLLPKESISFSAFVLSGHPLRQPKRSSVGKKHQKQTTKSKMILTCGGQKDVHAPTPHSALRKTRRPKFQMSCGGRWHGDVG